MEQGICLFSGETTTEPSEPINNRFDGSDISSTLTNELQDPLDVFVDQNDRKVSRPNPFDRLPHRVELVLHVLDYLRIRSGAFIQEVSDVE